MHESVVNKDLFLLILTENIPKDLWLYKLSLSSPKMPLKYNLSIISKLIVSEQYINL